MVGLTVFPKLSLCVRRVNAVCTFQKMIPIRRIFRTSENINHVMTGHLAYCTNIHRGETWRETFDSLKTHTLAVRDRVCPRAPVRHRPALEPSGRRRIIRSENTFGISTLARKKFLLRFHHQRISLRPVSRRARQGAGLSCPTGLRRSGWLTPICFLICWRNCCPPASKAASAPCPARSRNSSRPANRKKSSAKTSGAASNTSRASVKNPNANCISDSNLNRLCLLENSAETIQFFEQLRAEHKNDPRLDEFLGVNYDCCHFAVEFEEPLATLNSLHDSRHQNQQNPFEFRAQSPAHPGGARRELQKFADKVYLHQVVARDANGRLKFFRDLPDALADNSKLKIKNSKLPEWRIHFHVPLHAPAAPPFENTNDHLLGMLDWLAENPKLCPHLEMETYTWEVLPPELKSRKCRRATRCRI